MEDLRKLSNIIVEFYEKLSNWEHAIVEGSGFSLSQMHAIEILGAHETLKMKELAEKLGITTGTLTVTIDKLEKKGVVVRKANPKDRRSYVIELTKAGKKIQHAHTEYHLKMTQECTVEFSNKEKEQFFMLFKKFLQNL